MRELDLTMASVFSVASASSKGGQAQQADFIHTMPAAGSGKDRAVILLSRGGGQTSGRLAAARQLVINYAESLVARQYTSLYAALAEASAALAEARQDGELPGDAAASLLALHMHGKYYQWLNVGSGLLLLWRNGQLTRLTPGPSQTLLTGRDIAEVDVSDSNQDNELHDGDRLIAASEGILPLYGQLPPLLVESGKKGETASTTCQRIIKELESLQLPDSWEATLAIVDVRFGASAPPVFTGQEEYRLDTVSETGDRSSQQDSVFSAQADHAALAVVADGAGGHAGGKAASECVCNIMAGFWKRTFSQGLPTDLLESSMAVAISQANRQILLQGDGDANKCGKSTIVLAYVTGSKAVIAHVGDSRAYLNRAGIWKCLTRDDSLVRLLYDSGQITEEEMETHPDRSMLTQALGMRNTPKIHTMVIDMADGDELLLCCDGLWNQLPKAAWEDNSWSGTDRHAVLQAQVNRAIQAAGGKSDNVSAILLAFNLKKHQAESAPPEHNKHIIWIAAAAAAVLVVTMVCFLIWR